MKKVKISLILNIIIAILVTLGTIFMFTGFKFMPAKDLLVARNLTMFKFYTVDSNILIGLISLVLAIYEIRLLKKNIKEIPKPIYILKELGTAGIGLTFFITLVFLTPQYGFYPMYNNSNLIFHLIVPILSFVSYVVYEKYDNKYRYALLGIIPMFVYSIYYTTEIVVHVNSGGLTPKYDFYGFVRGNIHNIFISYPIVIIVAYLISLCLVYLNKKIK